MYPRGFVGKQTHTQPTPDASQLSDLRQSQAAHISSQKGDFLHLSNEEESGVGLRSSARLMEYHRGAPG